MAREENITTRYLQGGVTLVEAEAGKLGDYTALVGHGELLKPMTFIAQCEHSLGGTAYAFLDYDNLVATVVTQNT